jgi:inosine/xanthosine triphosphatase
LDTNPEEKPHALKVVVASRNPVKIAAAQRAFSAQFPDQGIEVWPVEVDSGVNEQPRSDDETRTGARTRAANARILEPDADFWVGLEGGTEVIGGRLMTFAWMAVRSREGGLGEARSVTLPLPPAVKDLVDSGLELGAANDRVFETLDSKHGEGAFGLLSDGRFTRQAVYEQTLTIALIPFVNPLYPENGFSAGKSR